MKFLQPCAAEIRNLIEAAVGRTIIVILLFCSAVPLLCPADQDGRWAILVSGASGDPDLRKLYLEELLSLRAVLETQFGFPRDHIFVLFDQPSMGPGAVNRMSTRDGLRSVCADLSTRAGREDLVFVFMEGHGSYDGKAYKYNLADRPDPTAEELASMLYSIPARNFIVINATSCSGGSLPALSQKGKIVITATKSGMEKNRTHFGKLFTGAFSDGAADSDKNGKVSIMEAFTYTRLKVEQHYVDEGSIQTEHPVLDDNGDAQAQSEPAPQNGDGLLARATYLDRSGADSARSRLTPEHQKLADEAGDLEREIEALKNAKSEMPEAEYERKLEALLLRLAQVNAKLPKQ